MAVRARSRRWAQACSLARTGQTLDLTRFGGDLKTWGESPEQEVTMPTSHPPYPPEFRAEAIRLIRTSGKSMAQIARELEVSTETLRLWRKQADIDAGLRHDGLTTEESEEVRQLRREIKRLREEREILVKAAAFFAKETGQTPR